MSRKFACLYLAVALLVSSIWIASADERDTVQQEVQYSAAVEALDAAGLTSRSSNVLPSGEGLALALELGLPEEETISLSQLPTEALKTSQAQEDAARRKQADTAAAAADAAAKEAARRYNQQLDSAVERDAAGEAEDTGTSYVDLVDVGESLGYITIPKIDVNLPIYEGTSDDVLQRGVGHLEGSSYPLGGESTHSVLTGHRGLPEAVLFTDLDKLEEGDCFYLHILDETLAYQVDQIKVVEPEHTEDLEITAGQDYCTLVTCTPYAINTHRMLVRGTRIPYNGEEETNTPQAVQYQALRTGTVVKRVVDAWPWIAVTGSIVIGGEALLLLLLLHRCKKREEDD